MIQSFSEWTKYLLTGKKRSMHKLVQAYHRLGRFSGVVLIAQKGEVCFVQGYGMANYELNVPNRAQTVFRLASLSKPFTAIAILQLQEKGRLRVDEPISTYLPDYPNGAQIRIHHLLTNTSGIPDYVMSKEFGRKLMYAPATPDELIALFQAAPLLFEPGERFSYSNSNWVLLGKIIELVSGQSYGDYLREHLFAVADMKRSGYPQPGELIADCAEGYLSTGKRITHAAHVDPSSMHAAGGLYATASDLYGWLAALFAGRLLSEKVLSEMVKEHVNSDGGAYGYGMAIERAWGRQRLYHTGGMPGFLSSANFYPQDQVAIIILSNFENGAMLEIERDLAAILFDQQYTMPTGRTFVQVDPQCFTPLLGTYTMTYYGRTSQMEITRQANQLWSEVNGLPRSQLYPLSEVCFFAQMKGEVEMTFVTDGDHPVQKININWGGYPVVATRVA